MKSENTFGIIIATLAIVCFTLLSCERKSAEEARILVFTKTAGYVHSSIPAGSQALIELGAQNNFRVDTSSNAAYFTDDSLKRYAAVVFLSTSGDVLDHYQEAAFERYIQAGGGFVGIHGASATEYQWGWYGRLLGGFFDNHPEVQKALVQVVNKEHPSTRHLPERWERTDEWYNFKKLDKEVKTLLTIDEESYRGGENGDPHPMAWYHEFDGGRSFYTALGHTEESFADTLYLQHLLGGIEYAIGENNGLDYSKAVSRNVPQEERFVRNVLVEGVFYEPMEMAVLPNLDVLVVERRGGIKLYKNSTGEVKDAGFLDVYATSNTGANIEEGLLGLAADPDFEKNRHVFMFYSPADTSVNRLSRFTLKDDVIDPASEKIILQFYSQRGICCHTGGSIAFGPGGDLFVSTGDNSTPFNAKNQKYVNHGYAPLDDRPGQEPFDARRTSSNTNDLRGKILRIKVQPDGSYDIPEGNLFVDENEATRPEIYTMGHRNPYRISVDQKSGTLYWGDIGPDARVDSLEKRGPRGFDEINQARQPGYFGWPLFIGDNYSYHRYNYATGETGPLFDPGKPVNDSRNNTGLRELPAAEPAFIWYPYDKSENFPQVGAGGRSAMAGPVYYADLYPKETRYPAYYHGKLFVYEWVRNWIHAISLQEDDSFDKMEPFMPATNFAAPVDIEVGPDGRMYVLEYGQGWFTKNADAGLARIDYISGNLPPKIKSLTIDKTDGKLPLTVTARVEATDPEEDRLTYVWTLGKVEKATKEPWITHTFVRPGEHVLSVMVRDRSGAFVVSEKKPLFAGNERPKVNITIQGNKSFYFNEEPVKYEVRVKDGAEEVVKEDLFISADYIQGKDLAGADLGHQQISEELVGKSLMQASDCKACHKISEKSIGPAYVQVAEKYKKSRSTVQYLSEKIIEGGGGVWGENVMPAHADMTKEEAEKIVYWVLSLAEGENRKESLPSQGTIVPAPDQAKKDNTVLKLSATYTDGGSEGVRPLSGSDVVFLRNTLLDISDLTGEDGFGALDTLGRAFLIFPKTEGWLELGSLDLEGIKALQFSFKLVGAQSNSARYQLEVRSGGLNGELLSSKVVEFKSGEPITLPLKPSNGAPERIFVKVKSVGPFNGKILLETLKFLPAKTG